MVRPRPYREQTRRGGRGSGGTNGYNRAMDRTLGEVSSAVAALSAMLTPALFLLAAGSILATTASRLGRVIDRVRGLTRRVEELDRGDASADHATRRRHVVGLLEIAARRARILQRAMTWLYLSIAGFVLTSVSIGVLELTGLDLGWLALLIGLASAGLLLGATVTLIRESRLALTSVEREMKSALGASGDPAI